MVIEKKSSTAKAVIYINGSDFLYCKEAIAQHRNHLEKHVLEKGWYLMNVYPDMGIGIDNSRFVLNDLINDAQKGNFDVILTLGVSSLLRGTTFALDLREELIRGKIHLVTFDGVVNTLDGNGHLIGLYDWVYAQQDLPNKCE